MADQELDVNGQPPNLRGKTCEALLLSQFFQSGDLVEPANVIHLKFGGEWHRLYFDHGIIFWRSSDQPTPWTDTDEEWQSPLLDLGREAGLVGSTLLQYSMTPTPAGSRVDFYFADGRRVSFEDSNDRTDYQVG